MRGTFGKEKVTLVFWNVNFLFWLCSAVYHLTSSKLYLYQPNGVKDHSYLQARAEAGLTLEPQT